MPMKESRRRVLEAGGELLGLGAVAAIAGCIDSGGGGDGDAGGDGDDGRTDDADGNDGDDAENGGDDGVAKEYLNWLYEPGTHLDSEHYSVSYQANAEVATHADEFDDATYEDLEENFESSFGYLGLGLDEVESWMSFGGGLSELLTGYQVDRSALVSSLEDEGFDEDAEYEGYQVYLGPDGSRAVGITNDDVLLTNNSWNTDDEAVDILETAVDTYNGEGTRYVDERPAFAAVTDQLDSGTFVYAWTHDETEETDAADGQFEGEVARGSSQLVTGDTIDVQAVYVFSDAEDVDMADFETFRDESAAFDDVDDLSLSSSDRSVTITGTMDTTAY